MGEIKTHDWYVSNINSVLRVINHGLNKSRVPDDDICTNLLNFELEPNGNVPMDFCNFIFEVSNGKYGTSTKLVEKLNPDTPMIITIGIKFYDSDDFLTFTMSQWFKNNLG